MQEEDKTRHTELIMSIVIAFALAISPWFWAAISRHDQSQAKLALMQYCATKALVIYGPTADITETGQRKAQIIDCNQSIAKRIGPNS